MWWRRLAEVQTEHQNGEERVFKWLWTGNGCWCQTGWSEYFINCWSTGIFTQPSLGFTENGPKKRKYPVSGSCVDENALLMSEVRGEWGGRLVRDDRKATVTQITARYNQGMQNTISELTTRRTLKQMGYSSRRPHRVPLLSAKNRKGYSYNRRLEKRCLVWRTWKHGSILPYLNGSGCWWWCNGVGDIFLAHFGPFSTNWASFKPHSLPEYCCWSCPSLYDYSVPIFWWLLPAG